MYFVHATIPKVWTNIRMDSSFHSIKNIIDRCGWLQKVKIAPKESIFKEPGIF